ncbi:hypothetical protein B0H14DRAFT_3456219 [Mycena olivaceomarginata]|nr:hypothetical protein B0H14DRAFT_3456219 [Mycena olivaceomarginata]
MEIEPAPSQDDFQPSSISEEIQRTIHRLETYQSDPAQHHYPDAGFGPADRFTVNGRGVVQMIQSATAAQRAVHKQGKPLHIRPAIADSTQTMYLGFEKQRNGQELHKALLLNANLRIHDPSTGKYGLRRGHAYTQLLAAPQSTEVRASNWPLRLPAVSLQQAQHRANLDAKRHQAAFEKASKITINAEVKDVPFTFRAALPPRIPSSHYLTHPIDRPPPFDTSNMEPIGTTPDGSRTVLKITTGSDKLTVDPRLRPGTPGPTLDLACYQAAPCAYYFGLAPPHVAPSNNRFEGLAQLLRRLVKDGMEKEGSKGVEQPLIDKNTDLSIPDHRTGYPSSDSSNSASTSDNDLASHAEGHDSGDHSNSPNHWSPICASPFNEDPESRPENPDVLRYSRFSSHSPIPEDEPAKTLDSAIDAVIKQPHFDHQRLTLPPNPFKLASQPEKDYSIIVSDTDSDSDSDDLPSLCSPANFSTSSLALATDGGNSVQDPTATGGSTTDVLTVDLVRELNKLRRNAPTPHLDENARAMAWVHMERGLEEFYNRQTRIDEWEDRNALEPGKHAVQLLWIALGETLDRVSMEKNELVEYEAFMRGQERAQNERANDNSQYMVGVFLDDTLIAVAKEDQMGVDEITLDSVAERVGMGIRRVCDEPEVPPSRHGRHTRLLAPYARERGPVFCAAVTAEYLKHRTEVSAFTDVRAHVLAFTHRALPCPPPLPFLFAQEYARLRLVLHTFRAHGYHPVANQASDLLHFQFKQPEVILQFLHSGLLDAADTYPEISREDPSEFWVADPAHSNIKTDQARAHHFAR